jgi:uncharacterized protein (TIGR00369 family)
MNEPDGFAKLLGVEYERVADDRARATVPIRPELLQPLGLVHGGVHSSLAESVASHATYEAVVSDGMAAMGQAVNTTFLRPVIEGTLHAEATARHRGRTTWVWDVELTDDEGRLCALSRVTVAVRPVVPG